MINIPDLKTLTHEQKDALIMELVARLNTLMMRVAALEAKLAKDLRRINLSDSNSPTAELRSSIHRGNRLCSN